MVLEILEVVKSTIKMEFVLNATSNQYLQQMETSVNVNSAILLLLKIQQLKDFMITA